MNNYLHKNHIVIFLSFLLVGCASLNSNKKLVVAEICVKDIEENRIHTYSIVEFHGKDSKENYNRLLLPINTPQQPILVGTTIDNSHVYSAVFGQTETLHYAYVSSVNYQFSFKRDFSVYNNQWSQWETADLSEKIDNSDYIQKLKVRFKIMNYNSYPGYLKSFENKPIEQNLNNCN